VCLQKSIIVYAQSALASAQITDLYGLLICVIFDLFHIGYVVLETYSNTKIFFTHFRQSLLGQQKVHGNLEFAFKKLFAQQLNIPRNGVLMNSVEQTRWFSIKVCKLSQVKLFLDKQKCFET
jgi:hypothetical protein